MESADGEDLRPSTAVVGVVGRCAVRGCAASARSVVVVSGAPPVDALACRRHVVQTQLGGLLTGLDVAVRPRR